MGFLSAAREVPSAPMANTIAAATPPNAMRMPATLRAARYRFFKRRQYSGAAPIHLRRRSEHDDPDDAVAGCDGHRRAAELDPREDATTPRIEPHQGLVAGAGPGEEVLLRAGTASSYGVSWCVPQSFRPAPKPACVTW